MFSIRRIYDDILPVNKAALREVRQIYRDQFPGTDTTDIDSLADQLRNPFAKQFRSILFIAENSPQQITGFAVLLHEPEIGFCFLDYLAADKQAPGRGIGAALYEQVRDEAVRLGSKGLFFECLPDEANRCADPEVRQSNADRLRFYEQYGARPIVGTLYELPLPGGDTDNLPHMIYDPLDSGKPLQPAFARQVARAILERKYGSLCPPEYIEQVVGSIQANPVALREPLYVKSDNHHKLAAPRPPEPIAITLNDKHEIHHIRERGYVESPVRISAISKELIGSGLVETIEVQPYPLDHILAVHDADFVEYLERACAGTPAGKSTYPYVFPIRNLTRPPREMSVLAGYYCIDTFTPINRNAFPAARRAVDCVLTAADEILAGRRIAYALVRPPGHHAERRSFGGFCYFSNSAIGANYFSQHGKVAILDVDYHHGNGQQDIFYERSDVLTISIHGDPDFAYPYFTGFADEQGAGPGTGFNLNLPLPEVQNGAQYRGALMQAIQAVQRFDPDFLVIALGLDPAKGDPTGTWTLGPKDFEANGRMLGALGLPTLVVQEGGYRTRTLGNNALSFFRGLIHGAHNSTP